MKAAREWVDLDLEVLWKELEHILKLKFAVRISAQFNIRNLPKQSRV